MSPSGVTRHSPWRRRRELRRTWRGPAGHRRQLAPGAGIDIAAGRWGRRKPQGRQPAGCRTGVGGPPPLFAPVAALSCRRSTLGRGRRTSAGWCTPAGRPRRRASPGPPRRGPGRPPPGLPTANRTKMKVNYLESRPDTVCCFIAS
jgi:hypothetical protein